MFAYRRSKAISWAFSATFSSVPEARSPTICAWIVPTRAIQFFLKTKGDSMQNGSMIRAERQQGPDVWEFRWREPGPDGKRKHRRMVVGSVNNFVDDVAARQAITGLHLDMNQRDERIQARPNHVIRTGGSLSAAGTEARYFLENLFNKGYVRRIFKKVDLATLGEISSRQHQRRRS